jgi:protein tyrosine phosphatase (PTP) superfamily phosphohydrolase (DUF442 family)
VPSAAGLDWLAEKGYRTLVDLRESPERNLPLITEATRRGLRYIALPISLKTLDRDHVARFQFELSLADARPLYFCDGDGSRAGALWYVRRISVDRVSRDIARREAEEIGLNNPGDWIAVTAYLERLDQKPAQAAVPPAAAGAAVPQKTDAPAQNTSTTAPAGGPPAPQVSKNPPPTPIPSQAASETPIKTARQDASPPPFQVDPDVWRPCAAMLVTGLAFPLAYWSRSIVPTILERTRASLPAPAQQQRFLPHELDA